MSVQADSRRWELWGLALTAFGVQFSVFANSLIKTVNAVPVVQAMQVRFLIQWCFTASTSLVLRSQGKPIHFFGKPEHRRLLLCRACCFALALMSSWTALRVLPVGDSTTITYLYPVICGILANQFLQEQLGWNFWCQAGTCFSGVLMVTGATFADNATQSYLRGVALALSAAFFFASTNCCVRALKDAQTFEIQLFTDTVMAFIVMPLTIAFSGNAFDWGGWNLDMFSRLLGATAFGLCALLIVLLGHQLAPASKATLFTYLEVPSAFAMQSFVFGEIPGLQKCCGAGLIIVAALHRFWGEAFASKAASARTVCLLEAEQQTSPVDQGAQARNIVRIC